MRKSSKALAMVSLAAMLAACGGGREDAMQASSNAVRSTALTAATAVDPLPATRLDSRLRSAKGPVDVWVTLDQDSLARTRVLLASSTGIGRTRALSSAQGEGTALRGENATIAQAMSDQRASILARQSALASTMRGLGAKELARVSVAYNAIAVTIDAAQLTQLAGLPGVKRVRPVVHYEKHLGETVPYIGASAAQANSVDGTGIRVAVLDSGIDYTHKNLGGSGNTADFATATANPTVVPAGLFPTAKVVGGYDYTGSTWSTTSDTRTEDPNPIDDGPEGGHGTHVADIIAGKSLDGSHKGVAPGAKLYAVKVCSSVSTSCNGIAMLKGMDFALDPNGDGQVDDAVDVVNMSLGSSYGQIEDEMDGASANAVALGVVVVASAGNSADRPYITGSPASTPGVISVAQTQVPSATAVPLLVNAPASIAGIYGNTALLDWAPIGAGVTGNVVYVGRGCIADTPLANVAGKIALIDRGSCNISEKVDKAARAGATGTLIGLIASGDAVGFSLGTGSIFVPSMVIQQSLSTSIKGRLTAGQTVNVTMSNAAAIQLAGSMVASSSRGPNVSFSHIKPEIGAPGASLSAEYGTGTGQTAFGGTSGAAPMVAGAAALVLSANPSLTPMQVKAKLMNSAETQVYTNPATQPGVLAPITRIGSGEVRVNRALALNAIAWDQSTLSAALSFGAIEAGDTRAMTVTRTLTVQNFSSTLKTFRIASSFRYANDSATGAVRVVAPTSVIVPARGTANVNIALSIDPTRLPAWTLNAGSLGGDGAALSGPEYDGYVTLTAGAETLSVPWHVLPRRAAKTVSGPVSTLRTGQSIALSNTGAATGDYELFSLIGTSPRLPAFQLPSVGDNFATIDVQSVGVRYLPPSICGGNCLEFAISNFGRRAHANYPAELDLYIDTNGDGIDDYVIYNAESGGFGATGQNRVYLLSLTTFQGSSLFYTDADLNSGNLIFTVLLNTDGGLPSNWPSLNVPLDRTLGISLYAYDNYFTGSETDSVVGMKFTPGNPRFSAANPAPYGSVAPGSSLRVPFKSSVVSNQQSSEKGLLMMYRRNAGNESQEVLVPMPTAR